MIPPLELGWRLLRLPLRRPLPVRGTLCHERMVLRLHLRDASGRQAWSEAAPLPGLHSESMDQLLALLRAEGSSLLRELRGGSVPQQARRPPSLGLALDLLAEGFLPPASPAHFLPVPCAPLLGLEQLHSPEAAGVSHAKLKVDPSSLPVLQDLGSVTGTPVLRLDGNGRLRVEHADALRGSREKGLRLQWIEDPCATWEESLAFSRESGLPLALDEGVEHMDDGELAKRLARPEVAALVLKPSLSGGLAILGKGVTLARQAGKLPVFSSSFESPFGLRQLAWLARRLGLGGPQGLGTAGWFEGTAVRGQAQELWPLCPSLPAGSGEGELLDWGRCRIEPATSRARKRTLAIELSSQGNTLADRERIEQGLSKGQDLFLLNGRLPRERRIELARDLGCSRMATPDGLEELDPPATRPAHGARLWVATGGSSGRSRLVALDAEQLEDAARGINRRLGLDAADRWLLSLPLYHVGGLGILWRCRLAGATLLHMRDGLARSITECEPTVISLVPAQLQQLLEEGHAHALRACRIVLMGGAPLDDGLYRRAMSLGLPLRLSYGLSEATAAVCLSDPAEGRLPDGPGAGRVLPRRELSLDGQQRIQVRGTCVTRHCRVDGRDVDPRDAEGWLDTGDRGVVDAAGRLRVLGRVDQRIQSGGENVQCERVEEVLRGCPGVRQALVVGVPDKRWGQRPVAVIQLAEQALAPKILDHAAVRLASYELPKIWLDWPEDLQEGLKVPRGELRGWVLQQQEAGWPARLFQGE